MSLSGNGKATLPPPWAGARGRILPPGVGTSGGVCVPRACDAGRLLVCLLAAPSPLTSCPVLLLLFAKACRPLACPVQVPCQKCVS